MSVMACSLPFQRMARLFILLGVSSVNFLLSAQTIEIKLIDGRKGHPVANTCVNVWVGDERKDPLTIPLDTNGVARLSLTNNFAEIRAGDIWKACEDFGVVNPVLQNKDFVKVNVGYVVCEPHGTDFSWLEVKKLPTREITQKGVVIGNTCGKTTASPTPGQIIIFVRPLNFWERLKQ